MFMSITGTSLHDFPRRRVGKEMWERERKPKGEARDEISEMKRYELRSDFVAPGPGLERETEFFLGWEEEEGSPTISRKEGRRECAWRGRNQDFSR